VGHFGLASRCYTHFTSPIRRYPDLVVHRLLKRYGMRRTSPRDTEGILRFIKRASSVATVREIEGDEAERAAVKARVCEFMERHIGEEYWGTVSGIMDFGFFVILNENLAEGLVHVSTLGNDYYTLDRTGTMLFGSRTGTRFALGDRVKVRVARVDRMRRETDFMLLAREGREGEEPVYVEAEQRMKRRKAYEKIEKSLKRSKSAGRRRKTARQDRERPAAKKGAREDRRRRPKPAPGSEPRPEPKAPPKDTRRSGRRRGRRKDSGREAEPGAARTGGTGSGKRGESGTGQVERQEAASMSGRRERAGSERRSDTGSGRKAESGTEPGAAGGAGARTGSRSRRGGRGRRSRPGTRGESTQARPQERPPGSEPDKPKRPREARSGRGRRGRRPRRPTGSGPRADKARET
jgi:ribonuclease R